MPLPKFAKDNTIQVIFKLSFFKKNRLALIFQLTVSCRLLILFQFSTQLLSNALELFFEIFNLETPTHAKLTITF